MGVMSIEDTDSLLDDGMTSIEKLCIVNSAYISEVGLASVSFPILLVTWASTQGTLKSPRMFSTLPLVSMT